ncbi:NUDIX domain-containing protein, partial [Limnoraphis robusta]|uniref:NUDIX domain-containing protein n=1 Tax=Limnoraphis robusta TaxID=1118279 RepID=UPI001364914D
MTHLAKTSANPSGQKQFPLSTVGALVVNYRGQVLIVKTTKWRGTWGVRGGKVEWGETRFFTALYPETIPSTLSKE